MIAATMGRRRQTNLDLPPQLHFKNGGYYYVTTTLPRRWINCGRDYTAALIEWARLHGEQKPAEATTVRAAWQKYEREVLPLKAERTQHDNRREAVNLLTVFGDMGLDEVTPLLVRRYMDVRGQVAKVRATREKALFSHLFNCARGWGLTNAPNPCAGIKGWASKRERYVTDEEYQKIYAHGSQRLRDAMDLALLTGQRPSDALKIDRTMIRDGMLWLRQGKRGKRLRIVIRGQLKALVKRCIDHANTFPVASLYLLNNAKGERLTKSMLRDDFDAARAAAKLPDIQFRDLRAKAATDVEDLEHAQRLLGHNNRQMTEHYVKNRAGDKVRPLR